MMIRILGDRTADIRTDTMTMDDTMNTLTRDTEDRIMIIDTIWEMAMMILMVDMARELVEGPMTVSDHGMRRIVDRQAGTLAAEATTSHLDDLTSVRGDSVNILDQQLPVPGRIADTLGTLDTLDLHTVTQDTPRPDTADTKIIADTDTDKGNPADGGM